MNTPEQPNGAAPQQQADALDVIALQLTSLQHSVFALGGLVQASLVSVQTLLAQREQGGSARPLPPLTRSALGGMPGSSTSAEPVRPATFNARPPAADGVANHSPAEA